MPAQSKSLHLTALILLIAICTAPLSAQDSKPWRRLVDPTAEEAWRNFRNPPPEYSLVMWWFWNGPMTEADIRRDLREMRDQQIRSVMIWAYYGLGIQYLSPQWFERIRFAVAEARKLDMRVWLMDEGSYPSGFVGGIINNRYPDARMRAINASPPKTVSGGGKLSLDAPPETIAVVATPRDKGKPVVIPMHHGKCEWTAPEGEWSVTVVRHEYRTAATRYVHSPGFRKNTTYSFFDALDPRATQIFLDHVHEEYRKVVGDEFGRIVLGIMGDEPSVAGLPWTAALPAEFERRKGYDLTPYLPLLFVSDPDDTARRVRADYWDVWTDLYSDNFFRPQTEWCERHGLDYIVHILGEEDMKTLIGLNGDYFKVNRTVQTPGVDAIWRQIWPGVRADYPKLASSSAHLRGRPRAFTEAYAVYGQGLSLEQAKWVMDHHFARGINHFQAMEYLSSDAEHRQYFHPPNWRGSTQWSHFHKLAEYANRLSYLLSVGRPAADIAVYYPTTSGWMQDFEPDKSTLSIAAALMQRQRDFDFIDEDTLRHPAGLRDGALFNHSGQGYRTILLPSTRVLSSEALATLEKFEKSGGRVFLLGEAPRMIAGRTFLHAEPRALPWQRSSLEDALRRMPASDLRLTPSAPEVSYLHRRWKDADMYFLFNEGNSALDLEARFQGAGDPEIWNPSTGARHPMPARLILEPFETKVVVLSGRRLPRPAAPKPPQTLLTIEGEWQLQIGNASLNTPLRNWADLQQATFWGTATYQKSFELKELPRNLILDLGEVKYSASVKLNGKDLGAVMWRPFRWDIGAHVRKGVNRLEVEVTNTRANELADDARRRDIESRGWLTNSYIGTYLKFDQEMAPSGLMGPVRILTNN